MISFAKAYDQGGRMWVQFEDGSDGVIDLSPLFTQGGVFEPLPNFQHFAAVEVGTEGRGIFWRVGEDILDLYADTLWLMSHPGDGAPVTE